jgi:excisionase family DNA binding protein
MAECAVKNLDLMTANDVGQFLGLSRNTVYEGAGRGEIPHRRVGRRLVFSRAAIESWLGSARPTNDERRSEAA